MAMRTKDVSIVVDFRNITKIQNLLRMIVDKQSFFTGAMQTLSCGCLKIPHGGGKIGKVRMGALQLPDLHTAGLAFMQAPIFFRHFLWLQWLSAKRADISFGIGIYHGG